jgi:very-short-patch-repair endonuclease
MPHEGVHVWMRATGHERAHPSCSCVVHWDEGIGFPAPHGGCVSLLHALMQIAQCCGEEAFFVALESALRQRRISPTELARLAIGVPASFAPLFALAADDADSGLESLIRYRLAHFGIPVVGQVEVPGVGAVDLVIGDRLIVELDGKDNHEGERKRHKDLRRDALAAPLGYEVLRFDYPLVMFSWGLVQAAILGKISVGAHETVAGRRMRATARRGVAR